MTKIIDFISKNLGKLALIFSISLTGKEGVIIAIMIIIALYFSKSSDIMKKILNKLNLVQTDNHSEHDLSEPKNDHLNFEIDHNGNDIEKVLYKRVNNNNSLKNESIKQNIKLMCKKMDSHHKKDPYENDVNELQKNYNGESTNHNFAMNVNNATCSTPIFNMRTYKDIDFHFNFLIHDYDPKKINNLIMCKDIHKWMVSSNISNDDLDDNLLPVYFVKKINGVSDVYEYLKIFIHTDNEGVKIAFIQKGSDYFAIKNEIDELIEKNLIKDLLSDSNYFSYNLSIHEGVLNFLEKFLSLVLIPEQYIGEQIHLDIENSHENNKTFDYFHNIINSDSTMFNTSI